MTRTLLTTASSQARAEQIVERLRGRGIREILILVHHIDGKRHRSLKGVEDIGRTHRMTRMAKDATKGAVVGGLAAAAGIAVPFVGPMLLAVAPLTAAVGAVVGAAIGSVSNDPSIRGIDDMGLPDDALPEFHRRLERGEYLIFVRTPEAKKLEAAGESFREMECDVLSY